MGYFRSEESSFPPARIRSTTSSGGRATTLPCGRTRPSKRQRNQWTSPPHCKLTLGEMPDKRAVSSIVYAPNGILKWLRQVSTPRVDSSANVTKRVRLARPFLGGPDSPPWAASLASVFPPTLVSIRRITGMASVPGTASPLGLRGNPRQWLTQCLEAVVLG